jgi:hypothetical protein
LHRAKQIAHRECGWKDGDSGDSAEEKNRVQRKNKRIDLTPTGLLMEGDFTTLRFLFAKNMVDERYGDLTTANQPPMKKASSETRLEVF